MDNIIAISFIYLIGIAVLLAFNEINYRRLKIRGEITRKFAHFSATLATVPFPYIFPSHWYVLILAFLFFLVLAITQYSRKLKSIHDIRRKSMGSYLLPLSIYLTFLISCLLENKLLFILPMLILAICDPMAAILGINIKKYNGRIKLGKRKFNKTWLGTTAFFITSLIIAMLALWLHRDIFDFKTYWLGLLVATAGTLGELISWRGSDNLSIPMAVILVLVSFL
ncbi:diacylglycerol/polyprenol kinase family protein [Marinilabilia salmonicolor]|jgi:dolichol kinase|uniref:Phytol kinase n=1 Tax=Marinilabilia salmonicolor TaxID=989 RepID=A0A2T0XIR7_9BACT|nr:phosphatidate cytidylyltransferase [Marinilabilia salmonicolor]PRY98849.1 phytol kinase [Marinilabilia salmonicolor]RCW38877.1 phytol kinase [Marinilabilia salmonicolor]